jgi:UDP-glucose 4-epimerase
MNKIFVTGGAGYIGSHTVLVLLQQGYEVTVMDNLENCSLDNLHKVEELAGKKVEFIQGDIRDQEALRAALRPEHECVIHFAAYKSVIESQSQPLRYYENNVGGSIELFKVMLEKGIKNVVFSSSAAVYGNPPKLPIDETLPLQPMNVYARTKTMMEKILEDSTVLGLNSVRLRYFNVAGAVPDGQIGEDPMAMGNLVPRLFMNLIGKHDLKVYGNKFPTPDGTQIRDYIHVVDLAEAHVAAIKYLEEHPGSQAINLGTGNGTSVLQLIQEVEQVTGRKLNYSIADARPGEAIELYADPSLAASLLNWKAKYDYHAIIQHAWNWYQKLPEFSTK